MIMKDKVSLGPAKQLRTHPSISHQEEIGYLKSHDGFSGFKWMEAIHERDNIPTYAKIPAVSLVIHWITFANLLYVHVEPP